MKMMECQDLTNEIEQLKKGNELLIAITNKLSEQIEIVIEEIDYNRANFRDEY